MLKEEDILGFLYRASDARLTGESEQRAVEIIRKIEGHPSSLFTDEPICADQENRCEVPVEFKNGLPPKLSIPLRYARFCDKGRLDEEKMIDYLHCIDDLNISLAGKPVVWNCRHPDLDNVQMFWLLKKIYDTRKDGHHFDIRFTEGSEFDCIKQKDPGYAPWQPWWGRRYQNISLRSQHITVVPDRTRHYAPKRQE